MTLHLLCEEARASVAFGSNGSREQRNFSTHLWTRSKRGDRFNRPDRSNRSDSSRGGGWERISQKFRFPGGRPVLVTRNHASKRWCHPPVITCVRGWWVTR